jgi:hypothetical protein
LLWPPADTIADRVQAARAGLDTRGRLVQALPQQEPEAVVRTLPRQVPEAVV